MRTWLTHPVHISWRLAALCAGFVSGVASVLIVTIGTPWALLSLSAVLLRRRAAVIFVVLSGVMVGNWYGGVVYDAMSPARELYGRQVLIEGVVVEDPSLSQSGELTLRLTNIRVEGRHYEGIVWASFAKDSDVQRSDRVTLRGLYEPGFGTFIGMMRQATLESVVRSVPGDLGRVIRDWFADAVRLGISEPQASLGIGFLTGQKSALPLDLSEALQIAGLTHIVVASGYNLTILVRLARRLFVKYSKYWSMLASFGMIIGFISMTGLSPSMTRAGIVSALSLLAWSYGRSSHPLVLLPLVAAITVAWQPSYAWGDLGWQLSFAAFFGVMVIAPLLQRYFFGRDPPGILRQVLGETIAAHLVTLPLIVASFGVISHVAIVANLLIVPLVPLAMLLTFMTGVCGLLLPMLVDVVALPAAWLLGYMTHTAQWLAGLSWAQAEVDVPVWTLFGYVGLLLLACWWMKRVTGYRLRDNNPIV